VNVRDAFYGSDIVMMEKHMDDIAVQNSGNSRFRYTLEDGHLYKPRCGKWINIKNSLGGGNQASMGMHLEATFE
jgi:hypothetical protein